MSKKQVVDHLYEVGAGYSPFRIKLQCITGSEEQYLFLNVKQGNDDIISLHDRLYSGVFASFLNRELTYVPHLTIGRLSGRSEFVRAILTTANMAEVFEASVTEIVSEIIERDGTSSTEIRIPFP